MNEPIDFDGVVLEVRTNDPERLADRAWQLQALGLEEQGELLLVTFAGREAALRAAGQLQADGADVSVREQPAPDWVANWRTHARPTVEPPFEIHPPWLASQGEQLAVVIDPGPTFGHGGHPTTRLMLRAMAPLIEPGVSVLDVGCGSGVLAIAAARLEAEVTAIDIDPAAVAVTAENAAANGVTVAVTNTPLAAIATSFDLVLVNVLGATMTELAPDLRRVARRHLLVSGLLSGQHVPGLDDLEVTDEEDGWVVADLRFV
ncbi:MAG: 50S ribosomal protein L11 methyltransferase [Acidimicrobiales bacterium]